MRGRDAVEFTITLTLALLGFANSTPCPGQRAARNSKVPRKMQH